MKICLINQGRILREQKIGLLFWSWWLPLYPCLTPGSRCCFPRCFIFVGPDVLFFGPVALLFWTQCFFLVLMLYFFGPGGFLSTLAAPHVPDALLLTILTRGPTSTPQCHTHSPPLHSHSNTTPSF